MSWLKHHSGQVVLIPAVVLLAVGIAAAVAGNDAARDLAWIVAGLIGLAGSCVEVIRGLIARTAGVDVLALLAMAGALVTGEYLAAALIAVMLGTGTVLDQWAESSARRELSLLLERAPRIAHRAEADELREISVDDVNLGDILQVASGEVVPVDARLLTPGTFDESALTGEAAPVERQAGSAVRSGVVNADAPVRIVATATAADSTYADVVRLVESAQADSSPYVRFADRIAWWFIPLALALAGAAWAASGDPKRAVAVLVVATPCPLLLAVPVAVISGVSQAARRGVVIKGGQVLEQLAAGRVLAFDKTGTLTTGRPTLIAVHAASGVDPDELLRIAASLDQASPHVLASALVRTARDRGLALTMPQGVSEEHGSGITGRVDGQQVAIGKGSWIVGAPAATTAGQRAGQQADPPADTRPQLPNWYRAALREADLEGCLVIAVSLDGRPAGALLLLDSLRPDAPRMLRRLRAAGLGRMVLVTGDSREVADSVGRLAGVDQVYAEQTPAGKVEVVTAEQAHGNVIMVGDGINDAPALAAASVGVAMAGRGATASSEAAGVVLTVDRIDRLADAIAISRRARRIAGQSAWLGMGLSAFAMLFAAFGFLPAAAGALLQELIDVAAIGNALRVRLFRAPNAQAMPPERMELLRRIAAEHDATRGVVDQIRATADALENPPAGDPLAGVRDLLVVLQDDLLPHEQREELELLPAMADTLGGADPVGALSRTHAEINHLVARLAKIVETPVIDPATGAVEDRTDSVPEARRTLYSLYAVLRLHNAQEDEGLFSLIE